jgi:hypothetical protein
MPPPTIAMRSTPVPFTSGQIELPERVSRPIFFRFCAVFAEAHALTFVARANSSIIASRIANFWTLPVTADGKLSTNRM